MSAGRLKRSASIILSRLTASMSSGAPSTTTIGQRNTLSMRRVVSGITHFGEGSYDQSEMVIQRLLMEAGTGDVGDALVSVGTAWL